MILVAYGIWSMDNGPLRNYMVIVANGIWSIENGIWFDIKLFSISAELVDGI
jgi:hypothetical protein